MLGARSPLGHKRAVTPIRAYCLSATLERSESLLLQLPRAQRAGVRGSGPWTAPTKWVLLTLLVCVACGGGPTRSNPLDRSWSDESGEELSAFLAGWDVLTPPPRTEAAIGVVDEETIIGRALPEGDGWRFVHPLESRPLLTGQVVVGIGDGELFALDARTGELLWTRPAFGKLRGASDDGATTLVSMASLSGRRSLVLAVRRDGHVARQFYDTARIGSPTVIDTFAFLPYGDAVVIFDLQAGTEAARVVSTKALTQSFTVGPDVYFGQRGALRLDREVVAARRGGGSYVELPARPLPGEPQWMLDGATTLPARGGATRHGALLRASACHPSPHPN